MRLDKFLADMRLGSRGEVKILIRQGFVTVNGTAAKDPGMTVTEADEVRTGGKPLLHRRYVYYMMNKPAGVLTATRDRKQQTVLDLLPEDIPRGIAPVGRLDKDTVGLLLLTNDGALAHRLLSPKYHVDKTYLVRTADPVTEEMVARFAGGLVLPDGTKLLEASLLISEEDPGESRVTVREGKFHQIKRMFEACGTTVTYLKRLSMGGLTLDPDLPEGAFRELTAEETLALAI